MALDDMPMRAPRARKPATDESISQDSIAAAFADKHEAFLRYCHSTGAWFRWTGTHWKQDTERLAFNHVRELSRRATTNSRPGEQRSVRSAQFASGVERFAQADPRLAATSEFWDCDIWLLGTPDGTVDLRTGLLRPALSAEGITRLTAVSPATDEKCPVWKQFLWEATDGDECLIRFLQQWVGYSLTGDIREQSLAFAHGDGGNGKGTFINTIAAIFGAYAVTAAMDTFTASKFTKHSTDLAMLKGARMVNASETEEGHAWAEGRIKNITGGDPITARFMRRDNFTYIPQFKLFIIGNHKPVLKNIDNAVRRRFNIIPFTVKPATVDKMLPEKLRAEWPAILRWAINGCLDWQANGLVRPQIVIDDTAAYFAEQDVFGQWLDDRCDVNKNAYWRTSATVLYLNWRDYAVATGEEPGSLKSFSTRLEQRHFQRYRTMQNRGFDGIRIRQVEMTDDG